VLGTLVPPTKISVMFALVLTPLIFTGCTQYPWPSLSRIRWFQVVTVFNPLTYVSESLRGAIVPSVPHMSEYVAVPILVGCIVVFGWIGMLGFDKRALD
jgi:ABC-2 type transport system permease protein